MTESFSDRNLLISIIALQMNYVTQDQMVEGIQHWSLHKSKPIEDIFTEKGFVSSGHADLLKDLAQRHLELNAGSVEHSLVSLNKFGTVIGFLSDLDPALGKTVAATIDFCASQKTRDQDAGSGDSIFVGDAASASLPGERYKIKRMHAKGGLGQVAIATDRELNREVALKQIQPRYDEDPVRRTRFLIEAEVTGRLEHPCIVPVYSLGFDSHGKPFYAMKLIRGKSFKSVIDELHGNSDSDEAPEQPFEFQLRQLVGRFVDVCQAIDYAHSRGILHRDIKPSNIMTGKYGETLVVDWGLAKLIGRVSDLQHRFSEDTLKPEIGSDGEPGSTETRMGAIIGTLAYMSPEQASGNSDAISHLADVYCLGATLFSVLTGEQPIEQSTHAQMVDAILQGNVLDINRDVQKRFPALVAICQRAMALRPDERYASAGAMAADLELWLADEPVDAYQEPIARRAARWIKRHQTLVATAGSVLAITLVGLTVFSSVLSAKNRQLTEEQVALKDSRTRIRDFAKDVFRTIDQRTAKIENVRGLRNAVLQDSYEEFKQLAELDDDPEFQDVFAECNLTLAQAALTDGTAEESLGYYETAIATYKKIKESVSAEGDASGMGQKAAVRLVRAYGDKMNALKRANKFDKALEHSRLAVEALSDITSDEASTFDHAFLKAKTQLEQAELQLDRLAYDEVVVLGQNAITEFDIAQAEFVKEHKIPDVNSEVYRQVAVRLTAWAHSELGQFDKAAELLDEEISTIRDLQSNDGTNSNRRYMLSLMLNERVNNGRRAGRLTEDSIVWQEEAIALMQQRFDERPTEGIAERLAALQLTLARCYFDMERTDEAKVMTDQALETIQSKTDVERSAAENIRVLAECYEQQALLLRGEDPQKAQALATKALDIAARAAQFTAETPSYVAVLNRIRNLAKSL